MNTTKRDMVWWLLMTAFSWTEEHHETLSQDDWYLHLNSVPFQCITCSC